MDVLVVALAVGVPEDVSGAEKAVSDVRGEPVVLVEPLKEGEREATSYDEKVALLVALIEAEELRESDEGLKRSVEVALVLVLWLNEGEVDAE